MRPSPSELFFFKGVVSNDKICDARWQIAQKPMAIPHHLNSRWLDSNGWLDDRPYVSLPVDVDEGLTRNTAYDVEMANCMSALTWDQFLPIQIYSMVSVLVDVNLTEEVPVYVTFTAVFDAVSVPTQIGWLAYVPVKVYEPPDVTSPLVSVLVLAPLPLRKRPAMELVVTSDLVAPVPLPALPKA